MIIIYILLAVITAVDVVWCARNLVRTDELDEREEELDKFSVHLDERANRIARDEETIRELYKEIRKWTSEGNTTSTC